MADTYETDHIYDGIRELDNPLPRWWLLTFWGTIVFSMGYWMAYHSIDDPLPSAAANYAEEKAAWDEKMLSQSVTNEELQVLVEDAAVVEAGKATFISTCGPCHGPAGQGAAVGPNLTDAYWIHGSTPVDIYKTISLGVPDKGMVAWRPSLGDKRVREATAYVLSMQNTNAADGKAPQGVDADGKAAE